MLITALAVNKSASDEFNIEDIEFLKDRHYVYNNTFTKACKKYIQPACVVCNESLLNEEDGIENASRLGVKSQWKITSWPIAQYKVKDVVVGVICIVKRVYLPNNAVRWTIECVDDRNSDTTRYVDLIDVKEIRERIRNISLKRQELQVLQSMLVGDMLPAGTRIIEDKLFKKGIIK